MPTARDLDKWFDLNVDLETRTIYMGSSNSDETGETGVDYAMASSVIKGIHSLESRGNKPILIMMNNPGGDWYHGMAIYDAIHYCPCVCTIRVYGYAMSMGSVILQAADERVMMPNSRIMIHYGSNDGAATHSKNFDRLAEENKRNNLEMEDIYLKMLVEKETQMGPGYLANELFAFFKKRKFSDAKKKRLSKFSFSEDPFELMEDLRPLLREMLNFDTFFSAKEAVALGFADSIYGEKN